MKKQGVLCIAGSIVLSMLLLGLRFKDESLDLIVKHLEVLRNNYPQEKVHLHFDKPYYSVGDDIWFKAYVVNAEKNELSAVSKVLHVEITDEADSVRRSILLPVENGLCQGDISLPDSVFNAGNYRIRAYTRWMENFDNDYFFDKPITIGDALNSPLLANADIKTIRNDDKQVLNAVINYKTLNNEVLVSKPVTYTLMWQNKLLQTGKAETDDKGNITINTPIKPGINTADVFINTLIKTSKAQSTKRTFRAARSVILGSVSFFPEGGNLVAGLRSKVGFKAIGPNGLGVDVTGYVEDEKGNKLLDIKTMHAGMGVFALTPQAGHNYTAVIDIPGQGTKKYPLPQAQPDGYLLAVDHLPGDSITVKVAVSADLVGSGDAILMAQNNGKVQYVSKIKLDRPVTASALPAVKFGAGISQVTLFNSNYEPVAERLVFIQSADKLNLKLDADKPNYTKRQKVSLDMAVTDAGGNPVRGAFSMAVTDEGKVAFNDDDEITIQSNLLLTSDLKGYIEQPNYYFNDVTRAKQQQLDALMLTQGWRRFTWGAIKAGEYPDIKYPAENGLRVTGVLRNLWGKPLPKGKVTLFASTNYGPLLVDTVADEKGHFVFDGLDFLDTTRVVVKAKRAGGSDNVKVLLDAPSVADSLSTMIWKPEGGLTTAAVINYLKKSEKRFNVLSSNGLIDKGVIQLKEVQVRDTRPPKIYRSEFPADLRADVTLTPDKMQTAAHISELLRSQTRIQIFANRVWGIRRGDRGQMLIMLDGQIMETLDGISPMALAGIQVLHGSVTTESLGMMAGGMTKPILEPFKYSLRSAFYGIIYLTTERRATKYNSPPKPSMGYIKPRGYAVTRQFYSPAYDVEKPEHQMADLRSTVFWKPDIITNNDGRAAVTFYTADEPGNYRVVIEGLDLDGRLLRKVTNISVN